MKYIAIVRYQFLTGEWKYLPTSRVYKSDFFEDKETALEWIKNKLPEIMEEYEGRNVYKSCNETILAIDLENSINYEGFFNQIYN